MLKWTLREWWLQRIFILQHFVLRTLLHSNLLTTFFIPFIKRNNANKKVRQWHFNIFLHSSQNIECQIILTFLFLTFKLSIFKIMISVIYDIVSMLDEIFKYVFQDINDIRSIQKGTIREIFSDTLFTLYSIFYFKTSPCWKYISHWRINFFCCIMM